MNRFQLYRLLSRNNKLGFRRSPVFEQSMVAKVMMWFGAAFTSIYLIMFGVMFSTSVLYVAPSMSNGIYASSYEVDSGKSAIRIVFLTSQGVFPDRQFSLAVA
jgi:hypothetical protein